MRIGVDVFYRVSTSNGNGIGNYSEGLFRRLAECPEVQIYPFHADDNWTQDEFAERLKQFIQENHIDIFHFFSPIEIRHPQVFANTDFRPACITATVYDIIPLVFQDIYLGDSRIREFYLTQLKMLEHMDHLFAISEYTRQDFLGIGIRPERITTVGTGRDNDFYYMPASTLVDMRTLFSIHEPYLLGFSPSDWRKNSERLVRAFSLATYDNEQRHQLVFVNAVSDTVREHLYNVAREYSTEDRIHFTGRISQLHLLRLLIRAHAMVFPSLYEGFGMPVLEAMQCGTPVITSNTSSMPEVAGDAAIYVDPTDVNGIAQGIREVLRDAELRRTLKKAGLQRAKLFDWTLVTNHMLSTYQSLLQENLSNRMPIRLQPNSCTMVNTSNTSSLPDVASDAAVCAEHNEFQENLSNRMPMVNTSNTSSLPDVASDAAVCAEHNEFQESVLNRKTFRLRPNRCEFVKRKSRNSTPVYFSFNLAELPSGSIIENAEMHIPTKRNSKKQRIYKVKAHWSTRSIRQSPHPRVSPLRKVMHKQTVSKRRKYSLIRFECTKLAKKWARHHLRNHGLYVRRANRKRKPSLYVTVKLPAET